MAMKIRGARLLPALVLASAPALAEEVRMYRSGEIPQASEVANILRGGAPVAHEAEPPRMKMRGISLDPVEKVHKDLDPGVSKVTQPPSQTVVRSESSVVGLPVEFAFNSAEILPSNEPQLDAVAEGIKMAGDITVVVEGHTDAYGSEAYNNRLSLQRAEAVRRYLMERHGISGTKLVVEGHGESSPLDPSNPFADANRRVQLRAAH